MWREAGRTLSRVKHRLVADYTADPWLKVILALALVLSGFFFWHRIPEFATVDERWRLLDVLSAVGIFAEDPGLDSLYSAVLAQRLAGATLYLYGVVLVPVFVVVAISGRLDAFATVSPRVYPEWIWTWSLLLARFVNVLLAVGCVYLTYRVGVMMRDRVTGRLAAVLLSLTFGFLFMAHEVGEDMPALFCLLVVLVLGLRYVETGDESSFLVGCAAGGFAIAFKFTAATGVILLGVASLLHARRVRTTNKNSGWKMSIRSRLLGKGLVVGAVAVVIGFPELLVAGPDVLVTRIATQLSHKSRGLAGPTAPSWWWLLRSYLNGFGLPLFVATLCGVVASVSQLRRRSIEADTTILLFVGLGAYLLVFSRWEYVRIHHLLPTFPLLVLLLAAVFSRLHAQNPEFARPLLAVLLVTTGAYAGVGDLHYASAPRDEAAAWLETNAPENATMEVYRTRYRDAVFPREMRIYSYEKPVSRAGPDPSQPSETKWMLNMPRRCPAYVQLTYWDLVYLGTAGPGATRPPADAAYKQGSDPPWLPPATPKPRRAEHVRDLLDGEYPYQVVAEFGPRPPLWPQPRTQTSFVDLLIVGVDPWSITYGDDQDLQTEQYTLILKRTGACAQTPRSTTELRTGQ